MPESPVNQALGTYGNATSSFFLCQYGRHLLLVSQCVQKLCGLTTTPLPYHHDASQMDIRDVTCVQLPMMPVRWGVGGYLCAASHGASEIGYQGSTCMQLPIIPLRLGVRGVLVCDFASWVLVCKHLICEITVWTCATLDYLVFLFLLKECSW